jgi:hypothetical protein
MDTSQIVLVVVLTLVAVFLLRFLVALALCGGDVKRIWLAVRVSLRALRDPTFGEKVKPLLETEAKPAGPAKPSGAPLRLLALLQREGRLLDFLTEDIQNYSDADIGAGVRDIHRRSRHVVEEHLVLEPVLAGEEETQVEVPAGFDPAAIRLTGNVTGSPPFRGTLKHRGWRVKELKLAPPPAGQDEFILMPAEVELP